LSDEKRDGNRLLKKLKPNRFLIAQYCPFLKKIYQEMAHDSKIPGYATDFSSVA
jgi:hypothetical protein